MSTKFDDPMYLQAWKTGGKYPDIHNNITFAASAHMQGGHVLDLCCSYGLLGARLKDKFPEKFPHVIGVERDPKVVAASKEAGLPLDALYEFSLVPETVSTFRKMLIAHSISAIVARRAFPELFSEEMGRGHAFGKEIGALLHETGVKEILIEGRVASARTSNSLGRLDLEMALMADHYTAEVVMPNIALLKAR
jgi:hypothetical protein